jgi:hypothetical protein
MRKRHQHKRNPEEYLFGKALSRYHAPPMYPGQPMKGRPNRRVIGMDVTCGIIYTLHATKGYRSSHA